jgi:hypothetical protein
MTRADLRVAIKLPDSSLLPGTLLPAPRGRARVRLDAPGMSAALRPGIEMGLVAEDEGTVRIWRTTVLSVDGNEVVLQVKSAAAEEEAVEGALARVEGPAAFRPVHADGTSGAWVSAALCGVGDMEIGLRVPAHVPVPRRMEVRFSVGGGSGAAHGRAYGDVGGFAVGGLDDRPIRAVARVTACRHVAGGQVEVRLAVSRIAPDDRQRLAAVAMASARQAA